MNDLEEIRFGIFGGVRAAKVNENIKSALKTAERHSKFSDALDIAFKYFEDKHAFDTYVFCASEHEPADNDGVLSMWRGYGSNGNGSAIVFDTAQLNFAPGVTPLVVSDVKYASSAEREIHLSGYCDKAASIILSHSIPDDKIFLVSHALFERFKLFSLFTKHVGFSEEREWRIVYRHEFDKDKIYERMFGYHLGEAGVEPKLKFKVEPISGVSASDLSLEKLINRIILGPTTSSALSKMSVVRMLKLLGRDTLADRVVASTIPLRSRWK